MSIVQVNVSQTVAPAPNTLQSTGALISQGGTNLAAGTRSLIRAPADLTPIKQVAKAITDMSWLANVVTVNLPAAHGITVGQIVNMTIASATPAGYNGTFPCTATDADSFTYPLNVNPGLNTQAGTYIPADVAELTSMVTTFFAQGSQQAVYVLELGIGGAAAGVTALGNYIDNNPGVFYSYEVPKAWADEASYLTLVNRFLALTAKTYFFTTLSLDNYEDFADLKSVFGMVPAPNAPATEFTTSAPFRVTLNYKPSATNKVTPTAYSYLLGVTEYPQAGNVGTLEDILIGNANYVGNGAEGGISRTILRDGTTMDGRGFNYWYSVDWVQINVDLDVAAAIINGSNNPQNPLYYNQDGINRLQSVIAGTMTRGVSAGLVFGAPVQVTMEPQAFIDAVENGDFAGQTVINAQPFISYSAQNPNDFAEGLYTGFQMAYTPNVGFKQIIINVNVTDFVTG